MLLILRGVSSSQRSMEGIGSILLFSNAPCYIEPGMFLFSPKSGLKIENTIVSASRTNCLIVESGLKPHICPMAFCMYTLTKRRKFKLPPNAAQAIYIFFQIQQTQRRKLFRLCTTAFSEPLYYIDKDEAHKKNNNNSYTQDI